MVDFKELAHVTVEKLICSYLRPLDTSNKLNLWGVEILRSGNKETLATDLQKDLLSSRFFCAFLNTEERRICREVVHRFSSTKS